MPLPFLIVKFIDFSQPFDKHFFILPRDTNKYLVWQEQGFQKQQIYCAEWFLARCRLRSSEERISYTIRIFKQISILVQSGVNLLDVDCFSKIEGFSSWLDLMSKSSKHYNLKALVLTYVGILVMDYDVFYETFEKLHRQKIQSVISSYTASAKPTQKLSCDAFSAELTIWMNSAMEYDLIDNVKLYLRREWNGWPLIYRGVPESSRAILAQYDLLHRVARSLPFNYMSLLNVKDEYERAKTQAIRGVSRRLSQCGKKDRSFWAGELVRFIVKTLKDHSNFEEDEIISLVSSKKSIQKDFMGRFILIPEEDDKFFRILNELGLEPVPLTRRESIELYGYAERQKGLRLSKVNRPHALHFITKTRKKNVSKLMSFDDVIIIWEEQRISVKRLKKIFFSLAKKGSLIAKEICSLIK